MPTTSGSEPAQLDTTGVPQAIASTAGNPNPSISDGEDQGMRAAVKKDKVVIRNEPCHNHTIIHVKSLDRGADLRNMSVKHIAKISGEHQQYVVTLPCEG